MGLFLIIGFYLVAIGAGTLLGTWIAGVPSTDFDYESVGLFTGAGFFVMAISLSFYDSDTSGHVFRRAKELDLTAPAAVRVLGPTGKYEGNYRVYRVTLTVYPPDLDPYTTSVEKPLDPITDAQRYQAGERFNVRLLNTDSGNVMIVNNIASEIPEASLKKTPKTWAEVAAARRPSNSAPPGSWAFSPDIKPRFNEDIFFYGFLILIPVTAVVAFFVGKF